MKKNIFNSLKRSYFILIVTLCCAFGSALAFGIMKNYKINYETDPIPPEYVVLKNDVGEETFLRVELTAKARTEQDDSIAKSLGENKIKSLPIINTSDSIFNKNPSFLVWTMLILIMIGISSGSIPIYISVVRRLIITYGLKPKNLFITTAFAFLLYKLSYLMSSSGDEIYKPGLLIDQLHILFSDGSVLEWIVQFTIVFQMPIFICIFLIGPCADRIEFKKKDKKSVEDALKKFQGLEQTLQGCLTLITVLVVFSVLTSSALREAIKGEVDIVNFNEFPKEISYMYGLMFSFFLALIYVPAHFYLKFKQRVLLEHASENIRVENDENESWVDALRTKYTQKKSTMEGIKLTLTMMAPLISSFLPETLQVI